MGELPAGILQEELALERIDGGKDVDKQNGTPQEKRCAVAVKQDVPVGNEKLQLAQEPESQRQEERDGQEQCVRCHEGSYLPTTDRKSTRLNSSHVSISYAV